MRPQPTLRGASRALLPMHEAYDASSFDSIDSSPCARVPGYFCPACQSRRVVDRDTAKKAGAAIGTIAGAAGGISGALSGVITGAEVGVALGAVATPVVPPLGAVAGAVVGALSGGIAGCVVGASLGEAVDAAILRNRRCLACGHTFSIAKS